jgi:hypothetical protein
VAVLVAIARDEERSILEWLAHHLALGFEQISIYDHESSDRMPALVDAVGAAGFPVTRIPWHPRVDQSPQLSAYADAPSRFESADWLAFFDLDEFLVLHRVRLRDWLGGMPPDASAVGINWLTFGSGGRLTADYELVRDAFRTGPARALSNNRHIKSIIRPRTIRGMHSHAAVLEHGIYVHPDGTPLVMPRKHGVSDRVEHSVAQLHHYQLKSRAEFEAKIAKGRVGMRLDSPDRIRENAEALWRKLNRADETYDDIEAHRAAFLEMYERLLAAVAGA